MAAAGRFNGFNVALENVLICLLHAPGAGGLRFQQHVLRMGAQPGKSPAPCLHPLRQSRPVPSTRGRHCCCLSEDATPPNFQQSKKHAKEYAKNRTRGNSTRDIW